MPALAGDGGQASCCGMDFLHILYNGACPVCSREIGHYRRLALRHAAPVVFDDLNACDLAQWGIDRDAAMRRLHARQGRRLLVGVPAFEALWRLLPGWRLLAAAIGLPGVRSLAALSYDRLLAPLLYRAALRRAAQCRLPGAG